METKHSQGRLEQTPQNNPSPQEAEIMNEMNRIKQTQNDTRAGDRIVDLQKELETMNGSTVTKPGTEPLGTIIPASHFSPQETDNLNFSNVIQYAYNYVAGLATQVEQRGPTAGKIWLAVGLANGDTGILAIPDTISVYYSANNGNSYNLYAKIAFSAHNKIDFDNMDMEIIENTSGTKYLHIVYGYRTNGGYGQPLIGYSIVSAPTLGYAGTTLVFPGQSLVSSYLRPRITSDNTRYPSNPYITIVATQDSLAGNEHYFMAKVCRVLSPFSTTPAITYLAKSIYSTFAGHNYEVMTDVANFHNGSDSLIFVLSAYPGYESNLYFYKAFSNSVVYPVSSGYSTPTGDDLAYAKVASNGGTNQKKIIIAYSDNYDNSDDFDQWAMYSSNAGVTWDPETLDYTSYNDSKYGDIIGRRDADGSFSIAYKNIYGNMENVGSYTVSGSGNSYLHSLNTNYANSVCSPKPAFRYVNGDSCLSIWSYFYSVSSTGGCSASNLYVTVALEGFYDEVLDQHPTYEVVYLYLAETTPPYNIVDTALTYLDYSSMSNVCTFARAPAGNYYLIVKHRNTVETWSSTPVAINTTNPAFYNFTANNERAYGGNTVLKGSRWCLYSGDVDQNGNINLEDIISIHNDIITFVFGDRLDSDLNGDDYVNLADMLIAYNNSLHFVSKITPP
ncbi:MAG: hypothetical protein ABI462_12030 [Ignavibacteria bacterium]